MGKFNSDSFREKLLQLFEVLNTDNKDRDPYIQDELNQFPFINGGLFEKEIKIPRIDQTMINTLINQAGRDFNWSNISPTIFGAVFESTLNHKMRRQGGIHYTSVENIHKVIDPLFLDGLKNELKEIQKIDVAVVRKNEILQFQNKISSLKFLERITTKLIRLAGVLSLGVSRGVLGCRITWTGVL